MGQLVQKSTLKMCKMCTVNLAILQIFCSLIFSSSVFCDSPSLDFSEAISELQLDLEPQPLQKQQQTDKKPQQQLSLSPSLELEKVTISPSKLNFNNMIVNMRSSELTDITLRSSASQLNLHLKRQFNPIVEERMKKSQKKTANVGATGQDEDDDGGENVQEPIVIEPSDFLKECGREDKCPPMDEQSPSEGNFAIRSHLIDFKMNPYICRCDVENCSRYGDCCWNISIGLPLRTERNPWRCNYIHEKKEWVLMISECPSKSPSSQLLSDLCLAKSNNIPEKNYTYLMDIPVYSHESQNLYRNIYCARCHGERNANLVHWKTRLYCNVVMTPREQQVFIESADYFPGERYFQVGNRTCGIYIADLLNSSFSLHDKNRTSPELQGISSVQDAIPNVRLCGGRSVDSCPLPEDKDNDDPDSALSKDVLLCSSYTQHVINREHILFKNPHCARCNGVPVEPMLSIATILRSNSSQLGSNFTTPVTKPTLLCYRHRPDPSISVFKAVPQAPTGPQGISLLFDFALDSDEVLVGYDNLCRDDEIWDYLHKKCQMAVCQKGYFIKDDSCQPILLTAENNSGSDLQHPSNQGHGSHHNSNDSGDPDSGEDDRLLTDKPINSTCMRILLFDWEYHFVSDTNSSIILNSSAHSLSGTPIIFHPDEYEYWNETTLAVCAKHLHEGFAVRFSSVLNYISTVSLAISVIFSFLHIIIYLSLPKLRNLPGRNLFCLTICLFISQLFFLTLINHSRWPDLCVAASITMHYTFLAAFFWMQVMSFDIWRTFSGAVLLSRSQSQERKSLTFRKYSLFAWVTPMLIVSMAIVVEFLPQIENSPIFQDFSALTPDSNSTARELHRKKNYDSNVNAVAEFLDKIRPGYGQNGLCWFGQRLSLFIFFAVPVGLVITSNLLLFSLTAKAILTQNKEAGKVLQNRESNVAKKVKKKSVCSFGNPNVESQSQCSESSGHDQIKVKLYAKLALIMGLSWTLGFISKLFQWDWLQHPFVILNGLQGTFIFFAFDFKMKIWKMLVERYGRWLCPRRSRPTSWWSGSGSDGTDLSLGGRRNKYGQGQSNSTSNSTTLTNTTGSGSISFPRKISTTTR